MKKYIVLIIIAALLAITGILSRGYFNGAGRPSAPTTGALTEAQAKTIAEATCIKGGETLAPGTYNANTKTWWFDANLNATKPGCNPACVVSETSGTAEINWRCTGLVTPPVDQKPPVTSGATVLDLSNQGLDKLPMDIFNRTDLTVLDVSGNRLTGALPSQIGNLKKLQVLDASNNQMTGIPAEIGRLTDLQTINYANNGITGLPNELANLKNLKTIDLTGNSYSTYDMSIIKKSLPNLIIIGERK